MSRDAKAWTDDQRCEQLPPAHPTDNTGKCGQLQRGFIELQGCSIFILFTDPNYNCGLLQAVLGHGIEK